MQTRPNDQASSCATISWPERMVRRLAGTFIIISMLLAWTVSPSWLVLAAFVGVNLLQSSFTGFCPPEILFRRLDARRNEKAAVPTR